MRESSYLLLGSNGDLSFGFHKKNLRPKWVKSPHLNPRSKGGIPTAKDNPTNDNAQWMAILTRCGKVVGSDVQTYDNASSSKGKAIILE